MVAGRTSFLHSKPVRTRGRPGGTTRFRAASVYCHTRTALRENPTKQPDLRYEERLKECGLTTLETRRLRDRIEVFKILNGYENIDSIICFEIKESKITQGHTWLIS